MFESDVLKEIKKAIKEKDCIIHVEEHAIDLDELIEKANNFYPNNKSEESEIRVLCNKILKVQQLIRTHAALISRILISDEYPTSAESVLLRKQYLVIDELKDLMYDSFGDLEMKYS